MKPLKILYENDTMLVVDKPAGISVMSEGKEKEESIADYLLEQFPKTQNIERSGIAHRLDKDTSGILLVAKNEESLHELQKLFLERKVQKTYICLVIGNVVNNGVIKSPLSRSPQDRRKQKALSPLEPKGQNARDAITEYEVIEKFDDYTLLKVSPKTGRKHQIRVHLASINHPLAGDALYGFKNQAVPKGLTRQFLHASSLKINNEEYHSELPEDLKNVLEILRK